MAKSAGLHEPTAEEKDPGVLALKVTALRQEVEWLKAAQTETVSLIHMSTSMSDMQQQVLQRLVREITFAMTSGSHDHMAVFPDGRLNMQAYYDQYKAVISGAGEKCASTAVVIWSHGFTVDESIERAKVAVAEREPQETEQAAEENYNVEHFGGTSGQSSNEQPSP